MILFLILVILTIGLIDFINGINILKLISYYNNINIACFWTIYVTISIILIFLTIIPNKKIQKTTGAIFGFLVYYVLINILFMILPIKYSIYLEMFKASLALIISIIGFITIHKINIKNYNITVDKKIPDLNIIMFADLHLGTLINHVEVSKIVDKINKLKPDLILIPGDLFNGNMKDSKELKKISNELRKLNSKQGTYLSPGNHDLFFQTEDLRNFLTESNIMLLDDKKVVLNNITIIGRKDLRPIDTFRTEYNRKSIKDLIKNIDTKNLIILLDHQPTDLKEASKNNIDLTLSGHTHKGQIFPGSIVTKLININHYGYKKISNNHTIVTSGIGYWQIPLRVGSNSEIVQIIIKGIKDK